jgi:uncharacterized membrane protein (DUF485 family)
MTADRARGAPVFFGTDVVNDSDRCHSRGQRGCRREGGLVSTIPSSRTGGGTPYEEVQASDEFAQLRSRFRRFVFPVTAGFLVWYFLYAILSAYAHDFMATKVVGNINVGVVFGLLQFVSTFAITMWYVRWADREFDPTADALRERIEGGDLR